MTAAKQVSFFAVYSCHACGHVYEQWPGPQCKTCGAYKLHVGLPPDHAEDEARVLGTTCDRQERRLTGLSALDNLLARSPEERGAVVGHVLLVISPPGTGKTTLALQILAHAPVPLFLSAEQPERDVAERARQLGITAPILFHEVTELSAIERLALRHRPSDLVIDSLPCVYDARSGRPPGSSWTIEQAMRRLYALAHGFGITLWVIHHVNARGKARGPMAAVHQCDVLLGLKIEPDNRTRTLYFPSPQKNRGGSALGSCTLGEWP